MLSSQHCAPTWHCMTVSAQCFQPGRCSRLSSRGPLARSPSPAITSSDDPKGPLYMWCSSLVPASTGLYTRACRHAFQFVSTPFATVQLLADCCAQATSACTSRLHQSSDLMCGNSPPHHETSDQQKLPVLALAFVMCARYTPHSAKPYSSHFASLAAFDVL